MLRADRAPANKAAQAVECWPGTRYSVHESVHVLVDPLGLGMGPELFLQVDEDAKDHVSIVNW